MNERIPKYWWATPPNNNLSDAARAGDLETVQREHRIWSGNPDQHDEMWAWQVAARTGHLHILRWMLNFTRISAYTWHAVRAAQEAAAGGQLEVLRWLLNDVGAKPMDDRSNDVNGKSVLYLAAENGHLHVARYLCEYPELLTLSRVRYILRYTHCEGFEDVATAALRRHRRWSDMRSGWFAAAAAAAVAAARRRVVVPLADMAS